MSLVIMNDYNSNRTHCSEQNFPKIKKYITGDEISGEVDFEYQITCKLNSATISEDERISVFTFSCGNDDEKLKKIIRFMKILGEDHV